MSIPDLVLQEFKAESFLGIDSSKPVIIDFVNNKSKGITILKGDQGTRKTSTLTALMLMMGAAFDIEYKNFNNLKDETTKLDLPFQYGGANYHATLSGGRLTLKKQYKEANGKWIAEGSPKEVLRAIFGTLGISPMFLKNMDGKKQIEWFKKTFGKDEDASKKELTKLKELQKVTEERKVTNREIKAVKGWLDVSELYTDYENSAKKFEKPISAEKEKKVYEDVKKKKADYEKYESALDGIKENAAFKGQEIDRLEQQLKDAKAAKKELDERIVNGDKWLKDNGGVVKEYAAAEKDWLNLSKKLTDYNQWGEVLVKEKTYNELLEENLQQNDSIDKLRTDLLKITKSYLPDLPGLEIRVKVALDDEDEGIFYENKTLAQLSESELWGLFIKIWEDNDVRFIFCENIQDLGSDAVKTMNKLVKEKKAKIFASEMERGKKEMEIIFDTQIK